MNITLFEKRNLTEVAARLDVHPFDIARLFGQKKNGLPRELSFSAEEIQEIAIELGLEFWWHEPTTIQDANPKKALIRELAKKLLEANWDEPTRGDNLYRGLKGAEFQLIRATVNALIRLEILLSSESSFGIVVSKGTQFDTILREVAEDGILPELLEALVG